MQKLTGKEIIEKITSFLEDPYEFEYLTSDYDDYKFETDSDLSFDDLGLGKCEMVVDESFTSGEAYRIIYFKEHDVYIRQNGYYDSYDSYAKYEDHEYDVVVPYEKTIIDYKKVEDV